MRIVLQRVKKAHVEIEEKVIGGIGLGYLLFVAFEPGDHEKILYAMGDRLFKLKLFSDQDGPLQYSLKEKNGEILVISQFTLFAEIKKGTKPSFHKAASPEIAKPLYEQFIQILKEKKFSVQNGIFGAAMRVYLENDGPVTIFLDSKELFPRFYHQND